MKIFISHNMSSVSENEVFELRNEYTRKLIEKFKDVEIIDNYNHHMSPDCMENKSDYSKLVDNFLLAVNDNNNAYRFLPADFDTNPNSIKLWHLGRSIQQLGQADAIYFIPGHCDSRGCRVEKVLAKLYNIPVLKLDNDPDDIFIEKDNITPDLSEEEILDRISNSLAFQAESIQRSEYVEYANKVLDEQKSKMKVPDFLQEYIKH